VRQRFVADGTGLRERLDPAAKTASKGLAMIEAIDAEAELFAVAEQVDLAE
jgi:hypothetical protein